jgi:hypothetical protein
MGKKYKPYASKMREDLYRKLKVLSAAEDKPIQTLIEEAVADYLEKRQFTEEPLMIREDSAPYGYRFSVSFGTPDKKPKKK